MLKVRPYVAVLDDDESVCKALKRLLRSAGFDVAVFNRGPEFLRAVESRVPDCLVLDVHMPEMNGLDMQDRLKSERVGVPVIFITAFEDPLARRRALDAGAYAFLRKPFNDQALLDAVTACVEGERGPCCGQGE